MLISFKAEHMVPDSHVPMDADSNSLWLKCIMETNHEMIKVVKVPRKANFALFSQTVYQKFSNVQIKYKDSSGDLIVIDTEDQLEYVYDDFGVSRHKMEMYPWLKLESKK